MSKSYDKEGAGIFDKLKTFGNDNKKLLLYKEEEKKWDAKITTSISIIEALNTAFDTINKLSKTGDSQEIIRKILDSKEIIQKNIKKYELEKGKISQEKAKITASIGQQVGGKVRRRKSSSKKSSRKRSSRK